MGLIYITIARAELITLFVHMQHKIQMHFLMCQEEEIQEDGEALCMRECSDNMVCNSFKLKGFRLSVMRKLFTVKVVRLWHGLSREAVDTPSMEVFKTLLDGALRNLVQWKVSLPMAGMVELGDC